MNGVVIKALLNLVAKYVDEHGAELFEMLMELILAKINPAKATVSASDDPVVQAFCADADTIIAEGGE